MIIVRETKAGGYEPATGNPTLTSLDGKERAPLRTIMAESWTDTDRARFGIFLAEPFQLPDGKVAVGPVRYEKQGSRVVAVVDVEDAPQPPADTRTPAEKVEAFAAMIGLTLDELRAVLIAGKA